MLHTDFEMYRSLLVRTWMQLVYGWQCKLRVTKLWISSRFRLQDSIMLFGYVLRPYPARMYARLMVTTLRIKFYSTMCVHVVLF